MPLPERHRLSRPPVATTIDCLIGLALAVSISLAPVAVRAQDADQAAIDDVLVRYRTAVSTDDEPLFLTTLLSLGIPFRAIPDGPPPEQTRVVETVRGVADFRESVFHGNRELAQTFDQIEIKREGGLAQVSLRFVTQDRNSDQASGGWKTLILVKVATGWKIASEFYTVRALPAPVGGS